MRNSRGDQTRDNILDFIADYKAAHLYSPTIREIANHLGMSTNTIFLHLHILRDDGVITFEDRKARTIEIV